MNIVISCNDDYIVPARILIDSIAVHNRNVALWFVYHTVTENNLGALNKQTNEYGWKFYPVKIKEHFRTIAAELPCHMHFSEEMYYRLFLPWLLPDCERVLYLDCDILVRGSLSELYDFDLEDNYVGAAHDVNKEIRRESIVRLKLKGEYSDLGDTTVRSFRNRHSGIKETAIPVLETNHIVP